jgi:hypothetical protein
MAENVKQHVVPRFAIAFFGADALGRIFVRVKGTLDVSLKSPSGQGYEDDAFTVTNDGARYVLRQCKPGYRKLVRTSLSAADHRLNPDRRSVARDFLPNGEPHLPFAVGARPQPVAT